MFSSLMLAALVAAAPKPFVPGPTVEGVTEYSLPNGFRVILVPELASSTVTVNLTVLVGSRSEGYGEKGMAHLLEHMLFKGSTHFKDPKNDLATHGGRFNGTTSEDRTNYFETMTASDANLEFGIRFEADRLVNSFINKKDLDTEMTVVRNEFERSENNGGFVLRSRVRAAALPWHNYGRAVIGIKADIERVPVDNLKAFYKRYYQPDNAVLVVSGKFDEAKAFKLIADTFGKLPKPSRSLVDTFTSEPTQDGERVVTVRRVGGTPLVMTAWRIPAVSDPDYAALMVLQGVLGDQPQGRLHQTVVDTKKAASARCDLDELKEPGLFSCNIAFKEGDQPGPARDAALALLETPKPLKEDEVARSRDGWLAQYEQDLASADSLAFQLSNWAPRGDWRLMYLLRDRLKAVKAADVERVWAKYFKPQNRTLGEYVPTTKPDRAEVADASDAKAVLAGYVGGEAVQQGEAFDPSVKNIEARLKRTTLPNGAKLVVLSKKTRAATVKVMIELRLGTADTLKGQQAVAQLTGALLGRGTQKLGFKDFRSALERLKSQLQVFGNGQNVTLMLSTQRPQLDEALGLVADVLKAPALDAKELEVLRGELTAQADTLKSEPTMVGRIELGRALHPLPADHINATLPMPEQIAALKAVTLEQVKGFYGRFYGAQNAAIAVVGDVDPASVERAMAATFGGWSSKEKYERASDPFVATKPEVKVLATPDKANAWMGAGSTMQLVDTAPDYPALALAAHVLGGGASARLFVSLREKQGLSYGAYAGIDVDSKNDRAAVSSTVIYAPQNVAAVEKGLLGELTHWNTITKEELEPLRTELLQQRTQSRSNDDDLAATLSGLTQDGRTLEFEGALDEAFKKVSAEELNAAVKKYFDPAKLVLVKAGDFKTVSAPK
jgi:zinc protease